MALECLQSLTERDRALFTGLQDDEAQAVFAYLFSQPRQAGAAPRVRSRVIGLYDPFCDRRRHNLGVLWQAAPYSCCDHRCAYCYARSYLVNFAHGGTSKTGFRAAFSRCLDDLQRLNVPPRHLSMANSTDVLQVRLEREQRSTLFMLERIARHPRSFASVGLLTKRPDDCPASTSTSPRVSEPSPYSAQREACSTLTGHTRPAQPSSARNPSIASRKSPL